MSNIRIALAQEALQIGAEQKRREAGFQDQAAKLKLELQQTEMLADAAGLGFQRGLDFRAALGADYACPNCWVIRGEQAPLITQPERVRDVDEFKCRICDFEFSFPA